MDCSTPGLPVYHQLPEFSQTHVHWVSDAIQPSHPLSSPSPPTFYLSQHQGLFQWVSSSHLVFRTSHQSIGVSASASVLPVNIQDRLPLGWTDWISSLSRGLSRVCSCLAVHSSTLGCVCYAGTSLDHTSKLQPLIFLALTFLCFF